MDTKVEFVLTANVNHKTGVVTIEHLHVNGKVLDVACSLVSAFEEIGDSLRGPISFTKYMKEMMDCVEEEMMNRVEDVSLELDCD